VDPVAQQGAQPHQLRTVPQQRPQLPHLRRGDPRLRQQIRAQQLSQDRRINLVVLQPGRGDRLALQRVHQVRIETVAFEQLHQPPPAERRLKRSRRACRQATDHAEEGLHAVGHVPVGEHLAILIDHHHLGTLAMDVDTDVNRHRGPPSRARMSPGNLNSPG
jgi:hypothetical protein